jgi:hypothetical protein
LITIKALLILKGEIMDISLCLDILEEIQSRRTCNKLAGAETSASIQATKQTPSNSFVIVDRGTTLHNTLTKYMMGERYVTLIEKAQLSSILPQIRA